MIEILGDADHPFAIIIKSEHERDGIEFLTPSHFSQQLGYMKRPKDHVIMPHTHNLLKREVHTTQEVLLIKSGVVRVDFYDLNQNYMESRLLRKGDVILLADGGHGMKVLEECEIIEVKQGPYAGDKDKQHFVPVNDGKVKINEALCNE
ncbi:hypothetical protein N9V53_05280 [Amylibacter sp.]|nr:hypothetical protein [Amylibacter sp.]MDB2393909.1 hypothetical protein [bacterium]MDB2443200.1 hypothetical protein [Amylibacter sp.]